MISELFDEREKWLKIRGFSANVDLTLPSKEQDEKVASNIMSRIELKLIKPSNFLGDVPFAFQFDCFDRESRKHCWQFLLDPSTEQANLRGDENKMVELRNNLPLFFMPFMTYYSFSNKRLEPFLYNLWKIERDSSGAHIFASNGELTGEGMLPGELISKNGHIYALNVARAPNNREYTRFIWNKLVLAGSEQCCMFPTYFESQLVDEGRVSCGPHCHLSDVEVVFA